MTDNKIMLQRARAFINNDFDLAMDEVQINVIASYMANFAQWQIRIAEQSAWNAARKTHLVTDDDYNGYHTENVYNSITEWREER